VSDSPLKDFKFDEVLPKWAVERMITDAIALAFDLREKMIEGPRHTQNTTKLTEHDTILHEIHGGIKTIKIIVGTTSFIGLVLGIALTVHKLVQ
jgi:hypothetical protein